MRMVVSAMALMAGLGLAATPATANEKRDFESCDGRVHPARADDGMRGEATSPFGMRFPTSPQNVVAACDRALASARLLPTQTLRRAHLLRARGVAHIQAGDHAKALADFDLAEAATRDRAGDRFLQRSMGVSLDLLRAMALTGSGDKTRAATLARSAMAARPYSSQVQRIGAELLAEAAPAGTADWAMAMRLDPTASATVLLREAEAGNWPSVLALRPGVAVSWPETAPSAYALMSSGSGGTDLLQALLISLTESYALAATGKRAEAKALMTDVRGRLKALKPATDRKGAPIGPAIGPILETALAGRFRQIDARVALGEGRHSEALSAIIGAGLPKDRMTMDLLTALKAAAPARDAALVPDPAGFAPAPAVAARKFTTLMPQALLTPETPRAVIDYEKSRPDILGALVGGAFSLGTSLLGGVSRLDGFRSTINPDGTTKVEFVGNTPSAALVQEMTLLRAAEITREKGKAGFVITARNDYQRMLVMSQNGVERSRTPQGFKTELSIRLLDRAEMTAHALDATAVIDALGPLYYEARATKA